MTARTLEEIEAPAGFAPRITLEELEGRTTYRTPGPWRVAPTSDYPPGEKPGINIDAGEHGLDGFVCEVCGPNPDERMRADAYFIAHAPDLLAIAQQQRAALLAIWPFVEEDDGGFATPQYQAAINQVRAILGVGTKR